jgi:hypothetical protein
VSTNTSSTIPFFLHAAVELALSYRRSRHACEAAVIKTLLQYQNFERKKITTACKHPVDCKCPSRADERVICGSCVYRWKMPHVPDIISTGFIRNLVQQKVSVMYRFSMYASKYSRTNAADGIPEAVLQCPPSLKMFST